MNSKAPAPIEHDIECVSTSTSGRRYAWEDMKVGDSIAFPNNSAARANAKNATKRLGDSGLRFRAGFDAQGHSRVWRFE